MKLICPLVRIYPLFLQALCFVFFWQVASIQCLQAQALGDWQMYLNYKQLNCMQEVGNLVYCGSETSLWSYDRSSSEIKTYSKLNGMSDLNITELAYSDTEDAVIVVYDNANIDLFYPDVVINVPEIKRKVISGGKKINHVYVQDSLAYLSCSFGLTVYDLSAKQFPISPTTGATGVNQVSISGQEIYAATDDGLFKTELDNPFINQIATWQAIAEDVGLPSIRAEFVVTSDELKYVYLDGVTYKFRSDWGSWEPIHSEQYWKVLDMSIKGTDLIMTEVKDSLGNILDGRITRVNADADVSFVGQGKFGRPQEAILDNDGNYWLADLWFGLGKFSGSDAQYIHPDGPRTTEVTQMAFDNGRLWVAPGTISGNYNLGFNFEGLLNYQQGSWNAFNRYFYGIFNEITDIVRVTADPFSDRIYAGSVGSGLLEMNVDGADPILYQPANSFFESTISQTNNLRISAMQFDKQGDLWVTSYFNSDPIVLKTRDGEWRKFSPEVSLGDNLFLDMIIDDAGQKWIALDEEDGLVVYDSGADPLDESDDVYTRLNVKDGNTLKSGQVFSMAKDREGDIWIGTGDGVIFYSCYGTYGEGGECISRRPEVTIDRDEFTFYLMAEQIVQTIAVDGANRKWIGTRNGVWLMSPDGTEQVLNFNVENSPLLSNDVKDIVIDDLTGEVYFGTSEGIVSYRGTAVVGGNSFGDVLVYPNPVRPDYEGEIAIKGMAQNANVKITDVSGTLVYETTALGGQAIWDARDYNGVRASSGVYLLFCTNQDGTDTYVGKFLIVN